MTAVREPDWVPGLRAALAEPARVRQVIDLRPGVGGRPAAVLVLIGHGSAGPDILFVERAAGLRTHAGQVAFPGGAADPGDADAAETALREAVEETGVDRAGIDILGMLPPAHVAVSGFDVTTVVAWWRQRSAVSVVDPREAASIEVVPVAVLTDPANRAQVRHVTGYVGPAFQVGDHLVWGLTAHLLDGVLDLGGWQRPWDRRRTVPIPARYLRDRTDTAGRTDLGGPDAH